MVVRAVGSRAQFKSIHPFFQLTLTFGAALHTSDTVMTSDIDMVENDGIYTGDECESPYWTVASNFTVANQSSRFKKKGKSNWKRKKFNNQNK